MARKHYGTQLALWDNKTELAAQTVDLLNILLRVTQQATYGKDAPSDELKLVPRPFEIEQPAEESFGADAIADFLKGPF